MCRPGPESRFPTAASSTVLYNDELAAAAGGSACLCRSTGPRRGEADKYEKKPKKWTTPSEQPSSSEPSCCGQGLSLPFVAGASVVVPSN